MSRGEKEVRHFLPLKAVPHMLLLLLEEQPTHGVDLLERLEHVSGGIVELNAGSLYRTIAKLLDQGLIEPSDTVRPEESFGVGAPRKNYYVTSLGRAVLRAESLRQAKLLELAGKLSLYRKRS